MFQAGVVLKSQDWRQKSCLLNDFKLLFKLLVFVSKILGHLFAVKLDWSLNVEFCFFIVKV